MLLGVFERTARAMASEAAVTLGTVEFLSETDKAILVNLDGDSVWVPKSQIDEDSEIYGGGNNHRGEEGKLVVSAWWARQAGYV